MKLFENLPSQNIPISAEMLNQIKDNLVVVSPTEPTGDNREKVWIQKGKNLFNKNNCLTYVWFGENGNVINSNDNNVLSSLIPCKPNTKYTLSGFVPNSYIIVVGFDNSKNYTWTITNQLEIETIKTITTGANDYYIKVGFGYAVPNLSTLMVNQGDVALSNEEYIEPKIYIKNDNDVYEEFISKEDMLEKYSTEEKRIGTWIDGKPLYRKVISGYWSFETGDTNIAHNISNLDLCIRADLFRIDIGHISWEFPYVSASGGFTGITKVTPENVIVKAYNDTWSNNNNGYIILEYTKTTD